VGLGQHRYRREVEGRQRLGRIELRLGAMALDAALATFIHLVFEQRGHKAGGLETRRHYGDYAASRPRARDATHLP